MQALNATSKSFGIHYDRAALEDVVPTGEFVLTSNGAAPVIGETETSYRVLDGTARIAKIAEDSPLWRHAPGPFRCFDREYFDEVPAIREIPKTATSKVTSWCDSGINWDTYYATTLEALEKALAKAYSTDGRRSEIRERVIYDSVTIYYARVHNVRW